MPGTRHAGPSKRGGSLLTWVERLFVTGGVAALMWCGFMVADAYIAQRVARETLESMPRAKTPSPTPTPASTPSSASSRPARGTPLAELSIPRVGLSAVVLYGSDAHTLRLGLGHIESTPLPGEPGNVAIAGHRDSFFRPLRNIQVGDDIMLDMPNERAHYRVSSFRVVNSHEVSVLDPTRDDTLTLVTCYPFWFIGQAPDRFIVRATRVEDAGSGPHHQSVADAAASRTDNDRVTRIDGEATPRQSGVIPPQSTALAARGANDDERRVRSTIERFRLTYNARLARRGEAGPDGFVTFPFCEVAVAETTATATCNAAAPSIESASSPIWTFSLRRIDQEWAITSVGMS